jgi:hypothetical protein
MSRGIFFDEFVPKLVGELRIPNYKVIAAFITVTHTTYFIDLDIFPSGCNLYFDWPSQLLDLYFVTQ